MSQRGEFHEMPSKNLGQTGKEDDNSIASLSTTTRPSQTMEEEHNCEASKMTKRATKRKFRKRQPEKESLTLDETDYYFENGLRKVYPYHFTFSTFAKGRWIRRTLYDVFSEEFRSYTPEMLNQSIVSGKLTVSGRKVKPTYKLRDNDFICNIVHRHEVPVTADVIPIITDDQDLLVVNKPSSIPVHPCGRYRHNSLIYILAKQYGFHNLRTINRLDRLTSGVLILCKTDAKVQQMMRHIKNRLVQKEYICKVQGIFPSETVVCEEPLDFLSHKLGVFKVCATGKEAQTTFKRLSTDGKTSIVKCNPTTGRTHQIRVHLQYLGYPIVNDPLYNTDAWGPNRGKAGDYGKPDQEVIEELCKLHARENHLQEKRLASEIKSPADETETERVTTATSTRDNIPNIRPSIDDIASTGSSVDDRKTTSSSVETTPSESTDIKYTGTTLSIVNTTTTTRCVINTAITAPSVGNVATQSSVNTENVMNGNAAVVHREGNDAANPGSCCENELNSSLFSKSSVGKESEEIKDMSKTEDSSLDGAIIRCKSSPDHAVHISDASELGLTMKHRNTIHESNTCDNIEIDDNERKSPPDLPLTATEDNLVVNPAKRAKLSTSVTKNDTSMLTPVLVCQDQGIVTEVAGSCRTPEVSHTKTEPSLKTKDADKLKASLDSDCPECSLFYQDPRPEDLIMYLHALRYKGPDWEFCTQMPEWAA